MGVRIQKGDEGVRRGGRRRESPFPNHLDPLFRGDDGRSRGRRTGLGGRGDGGRGRALTAAGQPLGSDTATSGGAA